MTDGMKACFETGRDLEDTELKEAAEAAAHLGLTTIHPMKGTAMTETVAVENHTHGKQVLQDMAPSADPCAGHPRRVRGLQRAAQGGPGARRPRHEDEGAHRPGDRRQRGVRRLHRLHARGAARAGATCQEAAEAIGVTILMSGGPATIFGPRAYAAFEDFLED